MLYILHKLWNLWWDYKCWNSIQDNQRYTCIFSICSRGRAQFKWYWNKATLKSKFSDSGIVGAMNFPFSGEVHWLESATNSPRFGDLALSLRSYTVMFMKVSCLPGEQFRQSQLELWSLHCWLAKTRKTEIQWKHSRSNTSIWRRQKMFNQNEISCQMNQIKVTLRVVNDAITFSLTEC